MCVGAVMCSATSVSWTACARGVDADPLSSVRSATPTASISGEAFLNLGDPDRV